MPIHAIDLGFSGNMAVQNIAGIIRKSRGTPLLVGGCVRDAIFGIKPKDIDIEVYGIEAVVLKKALREGLPDAYIDEVGLSFGVLKVRLADGKEFDISLPRKDSVIAGDKSHRGFTVASDPYMSIKEACARRDFTVNSMAYDPVNKILYDYYGGMQDIEDKIIRMTDAVHFGEDALRVLRAIQFAGRWGFSIEKTTVEECDKLYSNYHLLAKERIWVEWEKLLLKGRFVGQALWELYHTGWLNHYPALSELVQCPQEPSWHPEGFVFQHSTLAADMAVKIANEEGLNDQDRVILVLAAILHDVGKPETTSLNEKGQYISPGHADAGVPIAEKFLESIGAPNWVIEQVLPLIKEHMCHIGVAPNARIVRRLAQRLSPATIRMLVLLVKADASGRYVDQPPVPMLNPMARWQDYAVVEKCDTSTVKPILMGKHLIDWGLKPGRQFKPILDAAFSLQLDGELTNLSEALEWLEKAGPQIGADTMPRYSTRTEMAAAWEDFEKEKKILV